MNPELHPTQLQLIQWSSKCSFAIGEYFDLCKPSLLEKPRIDPKLQFVLSQLAISCHLTSESVFLLISNGKLWDSDILIRAVLEGTFKYLFLCIGNPSEQQIKLSEYWDDLPEISRIKRHLRVQDFLSKVDAAGLDKWKPLSELLLKPGELESLQSQYPRKLQQQIEQRWSFNEIAQALARSNIQPDAFEILRHLNYSYGMTSHLVHQDGVAIRIIWDRNQREPERYESIQLAHGARGLSDLISMAMMRAVGTFHTHNLDITPILKLQTSHEGFLQEMDTAYKRWLEVEYGKNAE